LRNGPDYYCSDRDGFRFVEETRALWAYRHLVRELVVRDIKVRYKRSVLGLFWTMLSPLLNMIVLTVAFSAVLRQQVANYPVYYLCGTLFWTFFAQVTNHTVSLTIDAVEMTKRCYIPRSVFVVSAVGVGLVNMLLSLVPLLGIILLTGHTVRASWLFLPASIVIGVLFTCGVGFVLFTLASRFVDVRETYNVLLNTWFFMTPIVYAPAIVPERYRAFTRLNPMTYMVEIFRAPLYDGWLPGSHTLTFAIASALSILAGGWLFYSSKIDDYAARS
jgi:ABC-type polysaccharide/polyol phosphate export permease